MIRQYFAQRSMGGDNPLRVGVIAVGAIYALPVFPHHHRRERWIVEGFLNGECSACWRNPRTGHWESRTRSRRSDIAVVRSLRDGRTREVAVRTLIALEDAGDACEGYPNLPDVQRFHRRFRQGTASTQSPARCCESRSARGLVNCSY